MMKSKILSIIFFAALAVCCQNLLVLQEYDYTENPVDIPNPDRGFYRPQSYVVPADSEPVPSVSNLSATIAGTTVSVDARIVYMSFDLRNFSSNAPLTGMPVGPGVVLSRITEQLSL